MNCHRMRMKALGNLLQRHFQADVELDTGDN